MVEFWMQFAVVILCIAIGARYGGAGLGVAGGLGLAILVLFFHVKPSSPPINVILIIASVITCVAFLQASGGLDYLVSVSEKLLRKNPNRITFMGPMVCFFACLFCGSSYVAFSVWPVIAEVAIEARVRPERALSMSVIASQTALTGSPMSAATASLIAILAPQGVTPLMIMLTCIPACFLGTLIGCIFMYKRGPELANDPEFQRRVASGEFQDKPRAEKAAAQSFSSSSKLAVAIFGIGMLCVVLLGTFNQVLPSWTVGEKVVKLSVSEMMQIVMLAVACIMMVCCKIPPSKAVSGSVFRSGMTGVIAVFGIAWFTGTFFAQYSSLFTATFGEVLSSMPFLFLIALIVLAALLMSQGSTTATVMPLGVTLGIAPAFLVAMYPAVSFLFVIPAGATMVSCIAFDRTGTTKIGKYVLNHSYMLPGIVSVLSSVALAYCFSLLVF